MNSAHADGRPSGISLFALIDRIGTAYLFPKRASITEADGVQICLGQFLRILAAMGWRAARRLIQPGELRRGFSFACFAFRNFLAIDRQYSGRLDSDRTLRTVHRHHVTSTSVADAQTSPCGE